MEDFLQISKLNDFIFCPLSIYYHNIYGKQDTITYQTEYQLNGIDVHKSVDTGTYSNKKSVLQAVDVYCEKYRLIGKIDIFDIEKGVLVERKKHISNIYDGYIYQVYAQYFALIEMGYKVTRIRLYSYDTNKNYEIPLPADDKQMLEKFEKLIQDIHSFDISHFRPSNINKCKMCIYSNLCAESLDD